MSSIQSEFLPLEIQHAHRTLAPRPVFMIGSLGQDGPNMAPMSNLTQVSSDPQTFCLAAGKDSTTAQNIAHTEIFSVSTVSAGDRDAAWILGEKFSGYTGHSKMDAAAEAISLDRFDGLPTLVNAIGWCKCSVIQEIKQEGDHRIFLARVVGAAHNPLFMRPDGTYHTIPPVMMQVALNQFATPGAAWHMDWLGPNHP